MSSIPIGAFLLQRPIATGGAGEVWLGLHPGDDLKVAIKVLTSQAAWDARALSNFGREVRSVARLEHHGIVRVFDHGAISEEAAELSDDRLRQGSPYLAMELAAGTLANRLPQTWESLRQILYELLDALAYAHARGVVHLDLKPDNVLVSEQGRLKLADFGIAHAVHGDREHTGGGTPLYMAPEQFMGAWRDFGPWTDLYALGCVAWELTCGQAPIQGANLLELAQAHMGADPGRFKPRFPVPDELEPWLRTLLEKKVRNRYACAADAARALLQVDSGAGLEGAALWRRPDPTMPSPRLAGAGLGLYGLRELQMVGRRAERDALWSQLTAVVETGTQRAVVLRGSAGTGKSRLAAWLSERAHELGVATPMRAVHGDPVGPRDGLAPMLETALRCRGLARREVASRVVAWAPEADTLEQGRLTELIRPLAAREESGDLPVVHLTASERRAVVAEFLARQGAMRPAVVWLDDIQWGPDAMAFAEELLDPSREIPVLLLLTVRDDTVMEGSDAEVSLQRILARPDTVEVEVGALTGADRVALVEALGLGQALGQIVEERTGGNPLFAVQLVGDWVQRGLLIPRDDGFALPFGADVTIPDDLHDIWISRIRELLVGRPDSDRFALECAAVLGLQVSSIEWDAVCERAGHTPPVGLVERMEDLELARRLDGGWVFSHRMFVESVVRLAGEAGRLQDHKTDASLALTGLAYDFFYSGRIAEAEQTAKRAIALAQGDPHSWSRAAGMMGLILDGLGQAERARQLLEQALEMTRAAGDVDGEARALNRLGLLEKNQGRLQQARPHFERALKLFQEVGGHGGASVAIGNLAILHREAGRIDQAQALFERSLAMRRERGNRRAVASALNNMALLYVHRGEFDKATELFEEALAAHREVGSLTGQGTALGNLGSIHLMQGRVAMARAHYEQSLSLRREVGNRHQECNALADIARLHGQLDEGDRARTLYAQALVIQRQVRDRNGEAFTLVGLGVECHRRGELAQAVELLERGLAIHRDIGNTGTDAASMVTLIDVYCLLGRFDDAQELCDELLAKGRARKQKRFSAAALIASGNLHRDRGQQAEAIAAYEVAISETREMGDKRQCASALLPLGDLLRESGALERARVVLEDAAEASAQIAHRTGEATALSALAEVTFELGQPAVSAEHFARVDALLVDLERPLVRALDRCRRGRIAHRSGDLASARRELTGAQTIVADIGVSASCSLGSAVTGLGEDLLAV